MKNLFKHIIGHYLILWAVQIILILLLMTCFDHVSQTNFFLYNNLPFIFVVINYWLWNKLIGLFSDTRERFDARYPGKQWQLSFYRYIWPLISIAVPYILVAVFCYSGLYWHIQEKYYLWPSIPDVNYFSAKGYIVFILKFIVRFCGIIPIFIFVSIYNTKRKNVIGEKVVLYAILIYFILGPLANYENFNRIDFFQLIISMSSFLWYVILKPHRPTRLFKKANLNYYLFTALVISQFIFIFKNFNGFISPYCFYIALILAAYSLRAGWKAAVIGGICGLNIWSAVWWFFCLPDSVACRCKSCGALTFSSNNECPKCNQPLEYKVFSFTSKIKYNIRPGGIFIIGTIIIIILAINIVKIIDKRHDTEPIKIGSKKINLMMPYNFKDIIILKNGEVIGTNSAVVERFGFGESDQKKFQYFKDNEELYAKLENYSTNKIVRLARKKWRRKADVILKKLFLCDYDVNKIPENDMPDCDGELIELAHKIKNKYRGFPNISLYNCYDFLFSNHWYSISIKQRKERFNYYFKYNFPNAFLTLIAKYSEPEWYKGSQKMPITEYWFKRQKVYNEDQIKKCLFSMNTMKFRILSSELPSICASPLIRDICANYEVRKFFYLIKRPPRIEYDILRSQKVVLPYLRQKISKSHFLKVNLYLKILVMNPDLFTTEDFEIIKTMLNHKHCHGSKGLIMSIDRPELWNLLSTEYNYSGIHNLFPREFISTNAFDVCCKIEKQLEYSNDLYLNVFSRIPNEKAVDKVLNLILEQQYEILTVAKSDAINRAEIMKRFAAQSKRYSLIVDKTCNYPYPGAEEVLKSIRDKCSEEDKIKIDAFLQDD